MATPPPDPWNPRTILRYIDSRESSTQVILVRTELGDGYLKAMGNPEGEHALACEWVGTQLARWFGLPTFEFAIIEVTPEDELSFHRVGAGKAKPGPAFISKADPGDQWSGAERQLNQLFNPLDVSRLVVFDTWIRNQDRYYVRDDNTVRRNDRNVFLSEEAPEGQLLLRAMDHSHCFTNGKEILPKSLGIDRIRDQTVYGLFPEFQPYLDREVVRRAAADLRRLDQKTVEEMVSTIPAEWDVSVKGREALVKFVVDRAAFLAADVIHGSETLPRIMTLLWPQGSLFPSDEPETQT